MKTTYNIFERTAQILIIFVVLANLCFAEDAKKIRDDVGDTFVEPDKVFVKLITQIGEQHAAEKIASNRYMIYSDSVKTKEIGEMAVKNSIKSGNIFTDCGLFTCDMRIAFKPKKNSKLDTDSITGGWQSGSATVQKIFFYQTQEHEEEYDTFSIVETCVESNQTNSSTCSSIPVKNGTATKKWNTTNEQTDLNQLLIEKDYEQEIVIRFGRSSLGKVDIYPIIFGKAYKEWAWWDTTEGQGSEYNITISSGSLTDYQIQINLTANSSISSGENLHALWYNTTSLAWREIPLWLEDSNFSSITNRGWRHSIANGSVWIKAPYIDTNGELYQIVNYVGVKNNFSCSDVFEFCDTFNIGSFNTTTWTAVGTVSGSQSGGIATVNPTTATSGYRSSAMSGSGTLRGRCYITDNNQGVNIGLESSWPTSNYAMMRGDASPSAPTVYYMTKASGASSFNYITPSNGRLVYDDFQLKYNSGVDAQFGVSATGAENITMTYINQSSLLPSGGLYIRMGTETTGSGDLQCDYMTFGQFSPYEPSYSFTQNVSYSAASTPIIFINQSPSDITSTNLFSSIFNATYNITIGNLNTSSVTLYCKLNGTGKTELIFINGTAGNSTSYKNCSLIPSTNISNIWSVYSNENFIYPYTTNMPMASFLSAHSTQTRTGTQDYIKTNFLNVSNTTRYNIYEIEGNRTAGAQPAQLYACNSSYSSGNPTVSSNCALFYTSPLLTNHTHSIYRYHAVAPISITNGRIGTVIITPSMQILVRSGSTTTYTFGYITPQARTGSSQYSNNNGAVWTDLGGEYDAHLHQFDSTDTFYYFINASNSSAVYNSTINNDALDLTLLPPTSPMILTPNFTVKKTGEVVYVLWQNSSSPSSATIPYYLINLSFSNGTNIKNLSNTSTSNTFNWTNDVDTGEYLITATAVDSNGLTTTGQSEPFFIYNNTATYENSSDMEYTTQNESFTHFQPLAIYASMSIDGEQKTTTNATTPTSTMFSVVYLPPETLLPTQKTVVWTFNCTTDSYTYYFNDSYNFTIEPAGFFLCNSSINTTVIQYAYFDESTLAPVNATLTGVYTLIKPDGSLKQIGLALPTNTTGRVCLSPPTLVVNATVDESLAAIGYFPKFINHPVQEYYNNSHFRSILLGNVSTSTSVIISVKSPQAIPFVGYKVMGYKFITSSASYNLSFIGTTNTQGQTVQYIEPIPTLYKLVVTDADDNVLQTITNPDVSFCTNVVAGENCYYNIIIGSASPFYYGELDLVRQKVCSYSETTRNLSCSFTFTNTNSINFTAGRLVVRLASPSNVSVYSDQTQAVSNSMASLSLVLPNTSATYTYIFYGEFEGIEERYGLEAIQVLETGYIDVNQVKTAVSPFSWFLTGIICVVLAFTTISVPHIMIVMEMSCITIFNSIGWLGIGTEWIVGMWVMGFVGIGLYTSGR